MAKGYRKWWNKLGFTDIRWSTKKVPLTNKRYLANVYSLLAVVVLETVGPGAENICGAIA